MKYTATAEEIDMLLKRNESFKGTKPNFEKMRAYQKLKETCGALQKAADCVKGLEEVPPGRDHRHAVIAMDLDKASWFTGHEYALFKKAVALADDFVLFARGTAPRISFTIMNVWEE